MIFFFDCFNNSRIIVPEEILQSNLNILKYQYFGMAATWIIVLVPGIKEFWTQSNTMQEAEEKEKIVLKVLKSMISFDENKLQSILKINADGEF